MKTTKTIKAMISALIIASCPFRANVCSAEEIDGALDSADTISTISNVLNETASLAASITDSIVHRYERGYDQKSYPDSELSEAGCGLFSVANAVYSFTGRKMDMSELKKFAINCKGWTANDGLYRYEFFPALKKSEIAKEYNFTVSNFNGKTALSTDNTSDSINNALLSGNKAVIIGVVNHYMVMTDYNAQTNEYFVIDSYVDNKYRKLPKASWVKKSDLCTGYNKVTSYAILDFSASIPDSGKVSAVSIESLPSKTTYWVYENNPVQTSGLSLKVSYSDGSSKTVTSGFSIEKAPDMSHAGTVPVTLSYSENSVKKTVSYNITLTHPFKGSGSVSDPYLIENSSDLVKLAKVINGNYVTDTGNKAGYNYLCYKQTADINMAGIDFTPIGIFYKDLEHTTNADLISDNTFDGIYDGDGHRIDNLSVNHKYNYAGLFGRINSSAVIRNLSVSGNIISDKLSCGGIVGEAGYGGLIENCSFSGIVSGSDFVGGICGKLHRGGTISGCSVTDSSIVSLNNGGIIAGYAVTGDHNKAADITISNCRYNNSTSLPASDILGAKKIDTVKQNTITVTVSDNTSEEKSFISGDINNDGCIDISDLSVMSLFIVDKHEFTSEEIVLGDLDHDSAVGLTDLAILRQYLSKIITSI